MRRALKFDDKSLVLTLTYRALKPGGWFDQAEPSIFVVTDYVKLDKTHPFSQWGEMMVEAGAKAGLRFDIAHRVKGWLEEAGFVNVREHRMPWTLGAWSRSQHQREMGLWNLQRVDLGLKDFCSRRFANNMLV